MPARYHCGDEERRAAVAAAGTLNGIDFLEVLDAEAPGEELRQRLLVVRLLATAPAGLDADWVRIEGGVRVRPVRATWAMPLTEVAGAPAAQVPQPVKDFLAGYFAAEPEPGRVVVVHTDSGGDFSIYRLGLVDPATGDPAPPDFDPRLAAVDFSFKVECPSDFDCAPHASCPPTRFDAPPIDYLAKDYAGFRRLMLDRLSAITPDWRERSPADLGVALVELLAYVADRLSYAQDAAATEAYLGTARRRVSVRRHARLVDYALHEGAAGRAWVEVRLAAPGTLPRGTALLTRTEGLGPRVDPADAERALAAGPLVFETLHDAELRPELDEIRFHTWSDRGCCLAAGATAATLVGPLPGLGPGSLLLFEEVIGPRTGAAADADPERRHPVRLVRAEPGTDPLDGTPIVEVEWSAADALPFPLCVSGHTDDDHGAVYLEDVSVVRGNLVLAEHGRTVEAELPAVPDDDRPYRPLLPEGPLSHAVPLPEGFPAESPPTAAAALSWIAPARALAQLALETAEGEPWTVRRDLLASGRFAADVVAEVEDDGRARLRFGDEQNGKAPAAGTVFTARWRVGTGTAGNVGRDAIAHAVAVADVTFVRNPLPAAGGAEPESLEEARRYAPHAFRVDDGVRHRRPGRRRARRRRDRAPAARAPREVPDGRPRPRDRRAALRSPRPRAARLRRAGLLRRAGRGGDRRRPRQPRLRPWPRALPPGRLELRAAGPPLADRRRRRRGRGGRGGPGRAVRAARAAGGGGARGRGASDRAARDRPPRRRPELPGERPARARRGGRAVSAPARRSAPCGCCEGISSPTPVEVYNRPGLSALAYRVGTHGSFQRAMLARLSTLPKLAELTTRDEGDLSIGLLDAWAVSLDVLTFYQERLADEAYLRTADERRSLLELARLIGYEPNPGVAASTYLAFTVGPLPGAPAEVVVPAGTRAQSTPGQDELPQPFESGEEIVARGEWNALRPRRTAPQKGKVGTLYLAGADTGLTPGDRVLVVAGTARQLLAVTSVAPDRDAGRTAVALEPVVPGRAPISISLLGAPPLPAPAPPAGPRPLTAAAVDEQILALPTWDAEDLQAAVETLGWSLGELADHLADRPPRPVARAEVHAFRLRAAPFGHNAPKWASLPASQRFGERAATGDGTEFVKGAWTEDWDAADRTPVDEGSQGESLGPTIHLDGAYPGLAAGGWVALERHGSSAAATAYPITAAADASRADFAMSAKVTRLTLGDPTGLGGFPVRSTAVHARSERLALAERPLTGEVAGSSVTLEGLQLRLLPGRRVALTGERADLEGVVTSEVRTLKRVVHRMEDGTTRLAFDRPLAHAYRLDTVTLNANVAPATHGETKSEVLGSGDASRAAQTFRLRTRPLTYVPAQVPSGGESTLELRVNGVRWREAPDFYRLGPGDRRYVLRRDDDGTTRVLFGDGRRGARLPSGRENVAATLRAGLGAGGNLAPERIDLLATRPLGIDRVVNPVAAAGGEDAESRDDVRDNAPLAVRTLDRVVSLTDFEDAARAFAGIGKARADRLWDGARRVVFLTVAAAGGGAVPDDPPLLDNLRRALDRQREPFQPLVLASYEALLFRVAARVAVDPDHEREAVFAAVAEALAAAFSFAARQLGESVPASDVITVAQGVSGVVAVDLDELYLFGDPPGPSDRLVARPARHLPGAPPANRLRPAQLLTLAPRGIELEAMP